MLSYSIQTHVAKFEFRVFIDQKFVFLLKFSEIIFQSFKTFYNHQGTVLSVFITNIHTRTKSTGRVLQIKNAENQQYFTKPLLIPILNGINLVSKLSLNRF